MMIPLLQHYGFEFSGRSIAVAFVLGVATWIFRTIQQLKRRKQQLPFEDIPYVVPNPHWLLGHLSLLGNNVIEGQYSVCVEHAGGSLGLSTFYSCGAPVLSVLDAEAAERILKFTSERRGNPTTVRHFKKMFGEHSLLMINGKEWRANRDIVQRSFVHASLPDLEQSLLKIALRVESAVLATVQSQPDQVFETDALNLSHRRIGCFWTELFGSRFRLYQGRQVEPVGCLSNDELLAIRSQRRCFRENT
jgi:hypothetical protein